MTAGPATSSDRGARRVTVLSPHFDDVPLSLGQSLRDGALRGCQVRVRVVFGRTNWTTWIHPTPARSAVVSWWRTLEEAVAARRFGYRFSVAGWEEAVLRTGDLDPAQLLDPSRDLSAEPLVAEVGRWLQRVLGAPVDGRRPDLLLAPAGLGGHVDHRIVAAAAAGLASTVEVPIGHYEDRPYAAYLDADERDRQLGALGADLERRAVSGPITRSTQLRARQCYPSQMDRYFRAAMELDREGHATEAVWFRRGTVPDWFV
jgi:LmbE family N-acetylglucosaminyl deacetylase